MARNKPEKPKENITILHEEMRIMPDKQNRLEAVLAKCEVYANGERADFHGIIPRKP